jgi:hypothetical protein
MYESLQLLHMLTHGVVHLIQPILVPLCFVAAWVIVGLGLWSVWTATRDGVQRAQQMHRIPCSECRYFSGNYLLKCPVHPQKALSEAAIGCPDFETTRMEWPMTSPLEKEPH